MNHLYRLIIFSTFLSLTCLMLVGCEVEDCGCSSSSPISARWHGSHLDSNLVLELVLYFSESNSNVNGSGNLFIKYENLNYDNTVSCSGSFVSGKLVVKFNEIDSCSYEGLITPTNDSIIGSFQFKKLVLPLILQKLK